LLSKWSKYARPFDLTKGCFRAFFVYFGKQAFTLGNEYAFACGGSWTIYSVVYNWFFLN
jgi:hypothetical protein